MTHTDIFAILQPMPIQLYEDDDALNDLAEGIWTSYLELAGGERMPGPIRLWKLGQIPGEDEEDWWVRISGPAEPRKPVEPPPARGRVPGSPDAAPGS